MQMNHNCATLEEVRRHAQGLDLTLSPEDFRRPPAKKPRVAEVRVLRRFLRKVG